MGSQSSTQRKKEEIQLIGSELNAFDKFVWEYVTRNNYRWEVLKLQNIMLILPYVFDHGSTKNVVFTKWFDRFCSTNMVSTKENVFREGAHFDRFWAQLLWQVRMRVYFIARKDPTPIANINSYSRPIGGRDRGERFLQRLKSFKVRFHPVGGVVLK
jgi:hypothetical protein